MYSPAAALDCLSAKEMDGWMDEWGKNGENHRFRQSEALKANVEN